ncbi:ABC transporter permease [Streptococcus pneumoniae]|uniref:ABC transporter permease n=1 Tax=Streptococcus pneumoniae TaxID=1313 RepID=UPI0007C3A978|nr:ABC transporter permease [Streptococcus pneumoniae]MDY6721802.1 ABC transporter permease [Streptococcus pneumoniae]OAB73662.1 ABC transporter permease [Streptococcus pneumoniae]OOD02066.1 ABC transporter permease [Streptococcus pneumoniae]
MNFVLSSLSEGLLWSIVAIGVYLTFRILDIADMTAEGAFPLGAAVVVSQIQAGANPWLAILLALLAGMVAGLVSGMLHTKMKIPALLTLLMKTEIGLVLRSTGDNIPISEANGVNVDTMKIVGYMISNGLIALCGSLFAQNDGFSDVTSGTGTIVVGLSSEVLIHDLIIGGRLLSIGIGAIVYRLIILNIYEIPNLDQNLVRLFNAILLALVLFAPELQKRLKIRGLKLRNE